MGKFVLKEINGDLFSAKTSMAHCVGADLKMGMGIAVKFKQLFGREDELRKQNVCFSSHKYLKPFVKLIFTLLRFSGKNWRVRNT